MLVEFSILPLGGGTHLSASVAQILDEVDKSGLDYRLTAMGTIVEGTWEEVLGLIRQCHTRTKLDFERVLTTIRIDDKGDQQGLLHSKVQAVEKLVGRKLKT